MFGLIRHHRLVYRSREEVGGGVTAFAFTPKEELNAQPGQHAIVAVSTTARKPFSLASAPGEDHVLLGTSLASNSTFKRRLNALREGDEIAIRGPIYTYGQRFAIDDDVTRAVLLAQGVGITPIRSILGHLALTSRSVETSVVHVATHGHPFREDTERWSTTSTYVDHAADFRAAASSAAADHQRRTFYVAGAPAFVSSTTQLLRAQGVDPGSIREDKYIFYKPGNNLAAPKHP